MPAAARYASCESIDRPARNVTAPRSSRASARSPPPGIPSPSAVRSVTAASSNARATIAAAAAQQAVLDGAIRSADRRRGGEVMGDIAERASRAVGDTPSSTSAIRR